MPLGTGKTNVNIASSDTEHTFRTERVFVPFGPFVAKKKKKARTLSVG